MTAEVYRRAGILFDQLRLLPEEQRSAILNAACGEDSQLRRQVLLLLEFDREAASGAFLEQGAVSDAAKLVAPALELPASGAVIGNYRLGERIGAGGMGVVYAAEDTRLHRRVAVKVLPLPFEGEGPERVQRFEQEARAISMLNHPNIVSIFDAGSEQRFWYIATEFIDGENLRQRLAAGPLEVERALAIALDCARAMTAAHQAGVLHRDLKPDNIMLRPDGVVKVVDFGLARVSSQGQDAGLSQTRSGLIIGTPRYMAPEQARGQKLDPRCDVFSLGAVLYEAVTGQPAAPGESTAEILAGLLTKQPPPASTWNRQLPPALDAILAKALAKDPSARYETMDAFGVELEKLKREIEFRRQIESWRESRKPLRRSLAALALVALLVAGWSAWHAWTTSSIGLRDSGADVVPLTSFSGYKDHPSLSPDGTRVAFCWNGGQGGRGGKQERNIFVMPVGSEAPVQLTASTEDNLWPAWSPDGRQLAFGRRSSEERTVIYVMPSAGGPEHRVAEGGNGVSWSPDGRELALSRSSAGAGPRGIFLLSVETGAERELTRPEQAFDNFPAFSPDGRWVAFKRGASEVRAEIWIVPVAGGAARRLTFEGKRILGFTWTTDSSEIIASIERDGHGVRLWRIPIAGGPLQRLTVPTDDASNPHVAARGGRLVYTQSFIDTNIYRSDEPGWKGTPPAQFNPGRGLILSSREDHSPAYSLDGQWIAFVSGRSGNLELWLARQDGSGAKQLTSFRGTSVGTPRWSPDNRWIAFDCVTEANSDIWVIGADGSSLRCLTSDSSGEILPSWSPDGKWVYFASDRARLLQIWKTPAAGGPEVQVTRGGGRESWPSPDGQLLYFTRGRPEAQIWTVPVDGGTEQPVPELLAFHRVSRTWGVVPQGIYFISREDAPVQQVRFFDFSTRRIDTMATLDKEPIWSVPAVALSPNGKTLLYVRLDHEVNDLMLIENFR